MILLMIFFNVGKHCHGVMFSFLHVSLYFTVTAKQFIILTSSASSYANIPHYLSQVKKKILKTCCQVFSDLFSMSGKI